jgi:hypothetical protein
MGEGTGEIAGQAVRSTSLMQRLADLSLDNTFETSDAIRAFAAREDTRRSFLIGLVGSTVIGAAAYVALLAMGPKTEAAAAIAGFERAGRSIMLEVPAAPHGSVSSPFPLLRSGIRLAPDAHIFLRDVPEPVWFSRGERRDEHTWVLGAADLGDLEVVLRDGTPDAFSVGIEIMSRDAAQVAQAAARVHIVDPVRLSELPPPATESPPEQTGKASVQVDAGVAIRDWGTSTHVKTFTPGSVVAKSSERTTADASAASSGENEKGFVTAAAAPASVQRPEGMSALGAVPQEPSPEGRRTWWKMPLPAWAPFTEQSGRR